MSDETKPPYDVGYGRPPAAHRFKAGQSGNPKGRPKRAALNPVDILDESVSVTLDGRTQRRSAFEVAVRRLIKMALEERTIGACLRLLRLFDKYGIAAPVAPLERSSMIHVKITNAEEYEAYVKMSSSPSQGQLK